MLNERPYFSIGEVLGLLLEEFPDVTISKIRFLEGQGLIDPERTPSGYRKFYDRDLNRLRFILREQKDHYLPLKVIKERLEGTDGTPAAPPRPVIGASWALIGNAEPPEIEERSPELGEMPEMTTDSTSAFIRIVNDTSDAHPRPRQAPIAPAPVEPAPLAPFAPRRPVGPAVAPSNVAAPERAPTVAADAPAATAPPVAEAPTPPAAEPVSELQPARAAAAAQVVAPTPAPPVIEAGELTVELTVGDLCARAGVTPQLLGQLREYGLVEATMIGGEAIFGLDALRTATAAGKLAGHGLEARHLRTWKVSAEREATLFEQMLQPLMRQRNPNSRRQAADLSSELSRAGADLRATLMRTALRTYLDD